MADDLARLLRLYRSEKGIWRYEIERNGELRWVSLHTKDEHKARLAYASLKQWIGEE